MLDTQYHIETPEGIDLAIIPAGPTVRTLAFCIDFLIRIAVGFAIALALSIFGKVGQGVLLIFFFLLEWFYPVYFELFQAGATPGKKAMNLRVIHEDGTPLSFSSSLIRNLLRVVDFLPLFYITGIISTMLNQRFQRLGDLAAGTVVVHVLPKQKITNIPELPAKHLAVAFTHQEQYAILSYAERSEKLSAARSEELANILQVLLKRQGAAAKELLLRIANGLLGKR